MVGAKFLFFFFSVLLLELSKEITSLKTYLKQFLRVFLTCFSVCDLMGSSFYIVKLRRFFETGALAL